MPYNGCVLFMVEQCMFPLLHIFHVLCHRHANVCVTVSTRLISLLCASLNETYVRMEFCADSHDSTPSPWSWRWVQLNKPRLKFLELNTGKLWCVKRIYLVLCSDERCFYFQSWGNYPDQCLVNLFHKHHVSDFAVMFVKKQSIKVGAGGSHVASCLLKTER